MTVHGEYPQVTPLIVGNDNTPNSVVLPVPDAVGVVTLEKWRSSKPFIAVDGKRVGLGAGGKVALRNGGKANIKIKTLVAGKPRVFVDGVEVFTTPQPAIFLIVLAVLPALSLIILQGLIGYAIALGGVALSQVLVRNEKWSTGMRVGMAIGVAVITWALAFLAAVVWVVAVA